MGELIANNLKCVLDGLDDGVLAADEQGKIVYANAAVGELLGRSVAELIGQPLAALFPAPLDRLVDGPEACAVETAEEPSDARTRLRWVGSHGREIEVEYQQSNTRLEREIPLRVLTLRAVPTELKSESDPRRYLRITSKASARLGPHPDRDLVFRTALETLIDDFEAVVARIWLLDSASRQPMLRAKAQAGLDQLEVRHPFEESPEPIPLEVQEVLRYGQPFLVEPLRGDERCDQDWVERHKLQSLIAMPLQVAGERDGVLVAGLRTALSEECLDALLGFSTVISMALNQVRLLEREQAAKLGTEAEHRRCQSILDLIPIGVALAEGPDGRVTLVNPAGREILKKPLPPSTLEEFHTLLPLQGLDGSPYELPRRPIHRAYSHGEQVRETARYVRPDGSRRVLEITASSFPSPEGGVIATYNDVTQRIELQSELAERAAQFKALLDHLPVGVAYFDAGCRCRACNGPAWRILGRSRSQISGVPAAEIFAATPALLEAVSRCVADRVPHALANAPWTDPTSAESVRFLDWRFEPLPPTADGKPQGALALIVDVTGRKRAADELQAAKEAAEQSAQNKSRFLSAISHDLRTPVNALNLQAEMLTQLLNSGQCENLCRLATDLRQASGNLVELVNDLLDLTRFDSGEVTQHHVDFELDEWLGSILGPLELSARQKGLEFRWSLEPTHQWVRADRIKLGRIVTNLVGNALKFTEAGKVQTRVEVGANGWLMLQVEDTGAGIPADQLERIFDEFAQLRNPERDRSKGTGLGLAICRRLVEAMGGRVTVSSVLGAGSTFTVLYPVQPLAEAPTPAPSVDQFMKVPRRQSDQRPRILLVEDDMTTRIPMTHLLEEAGYQVDPASDGPEALELLKRARPDLVLLDLMMPGMDGTDVLRSIRAQRALDGLPVVILSGDVLDDRVLQLKALGATGNLAKPVDFQELFKLVGHLTTTLETSSTPEPPHG